MLRNKTFNKIYFRYLFSIIWTIAVLYLSLGRISKDQSSPTFDIGHKDKIVHFAMYFIYTYFLLLESKYSNKIKTISIIIIYTVSFGVLMEVLQTILFTYRNGNISDVIANTVGIVSMILIFPILKKLNNLFFISD